ncbi:MAG: hypothetical protein J6W40_02545, partial [Alphaproteobacteria bacterium]|nr:hypothetical protein [Alphaproteobacteria bacterium]
PDDLRLSDENIKKYVELSSSGDGNNYILFKLYNNQLPSLATMFNRIKQQHNGNTYGVYAENSTTSNTIINTSGTQTATSVPNSMYLVQSQSTTGGACTQNSDCGAGTCNTSTGECTCDSNATKNNNTCTCNSPYIPSGNTCVENSNGGNCTNNQINVDGNCIDSVFEITTTPDTTEFIFRIAAIGTIYVDWGDGETETLTHPNTDVKKHTHTYTQGANSYKIRFGGALDSYYNGNSTSPWYSISFYSENNGTQDKIASVSGSLAALCPSRGTTKNLIPQFYQTFRGATNLKEVPQGLFQGLTGGRYMFHSTFKDSGLESIPAGLFSGITTGAFSLFASTFANTKITSIPVGLFNSITSIPTGDSASTTAAQNMFFSTFANTPITSIPDGLFSHITTSTQSMFQTTFENCKSLTRLPENLFSGITEPANNLFAATFGECSNLSGYIPPNMFFISSNPQNLGFSETFHNTNLATSCDSFSGMQQFITGYEDYWNSGSKHYVSCEPAGSSGDNDPILITCTGADDEIVVSGNTCVKSKFEVTTITPIVNLKFEFFMSAKGTFYVDWGDGDPAETISRPDTTETGYYHTYSSTDEGGKTYVIRFGGVATGYSDVANTAALRFRNTNGDSMDYRPRNVRGVSGSLAQLFPQLQGTGLSSTPQFYQTFMSTKRLEEIPEGLFDGLTGGERMFAETFVNSGIHEIPDGLFRSITKGAPQMFASTFRDCDNLTSIPSNLFSSINNIPNDAISMFFNTFAESDSITKIPENLFAQITYTPEHMFRWVFRNCYNLTGYIPRSTFAGLINANNCTDNEAWTDAFTGTQLATSCDNYPNTTQVNTCYNDYWDNHVSCEPTGDVPTPTPECPDDCGAGTCNQSTGECRCIDYAAPNSSGICECQTGHELNQAGTACEATPEGQEEPNLITCTGAGNEIQVNENQCVVAPFSVTTKEQTTFQFTLSAKGTFYVDCGGGTLSGSGVSGKKITRTNTTSATYTCTYSTVGKYTVRIAGTATGYSTDEDTAAISFYNGSRCDIFGIDQSSSLGTIFPVIGNDDNGNTPRFVETFRACIPTPGTSVDTTIASIPANLFYTSDDNITPVSKMFYNTFASSYFYGGANNVAVPESLFAGIKGAPARSLFEGTFRNTQNLSGRLPSGLFSGISGAPADSMFKETFAYAGYYSWQYPKYIPVDSGLFSGINGTPAPSMFEGTFEGSMITNIPSQLFYYIHGAPAESMFAKTFYGCKNISSDLTSSENLFGGKDLKGPTAPYMFWRTFSGCENMTGSIPENLFGGSNGLSGSVSYAMFDSTFEDCKNLSGSIPSGLFGNISGDVPNGAKFAFSSTFSGSGVGGVVPADLFVNITSDGFDDILGNHESIFNNTFAGTNITGIEADLFKGITETTPSMFSGTFRNCTKLNTVPAGLFNRITGTPKPLMFDETFAGCTSLTSVPYNLFAGVSGEPAQNMFKETFNGSGLTSIDNRLFSGIQGAPAVSMFYQTFANCDGLTALPTELFKKISGTPAESMYWGTFEFSTNITGTIPENLFGAVSGTPASGMFARTFNHCENLGGYVPTSMYEGLTELPSGVTAFNSTFASTAMPAQCPTGYKLDSRVEPYRQSWGYSVACVVDENGGGSGGGGTSCGDSQFLVNGECIDSKFEITTTSDTERFQFQIFAKGTFYIDWGDGETEKHIITAEDFDGTYWSPSHNYQTAGSYTIKIGGLATGYDLDNDATISFSQPSTATPENIKYISGSLSTIFPTIDNGGDGKNPRFIGTFSGCVNLEGNLPPTLFSGLHGTPVDEMFEYTFNECRKLTGEIPSGLFGSLSGSVTDFMFYTTFSNCTGLTSIPSNLFDGLTGGAMHAFDNTFSGAGITSIPPRLFSGITDAAKSMFWGTFNACENLSGYIPPTTFAGLINNGSPTAENMWKWTFDETNLYADCPTGTTKVTTGYEQYWDGHVSCEPQ